MYVNLFTFESKKEGKLFRTSKSYDNLPAAESAISIKPDAGWKFCGTIESGVFPEMQNFKITNG